MTMFKLEGDVLLVTLPEGKNNDEIIQIAKKELSGIEKEFYGKDIKVNGRCTVPLAAFLGHYLSHICRCVSFFDPKENKYVQVITHGRCDVEVLPFKNSTDH